MFGLAYLGCQFAGLLFFHAHHVHHYVCHVHHLDHDQNLLDCDEEEVIETQIGKKKQSYLTESRYLADQTDCFDIHGAFPDSQIGNQFGKSQLFVDRSDHDVLDLRKNNIYNHMQSVLSTHFAQFPSYMQTSDRDTSSNICES